MKINNLMNKKKYATMCNNICIQLENMPFLLPMKENACPVNDFKIEI